MRATWRHLRANPVQTISMWLVGFVMSAVVDAAFRTVFDESLTVRPLLLDSARTATLLTLVLTLLTQHKRAKAVQAGAPSAE